MSFAKAHNYPWRQVTPGTYIQDYDSWQSVQAIWNNVDREGRRLHMLASCIEIQSNITDLESRLRSAWLAARYFHPGLAIELGEYYKAYRVPTAEELEAWVNDTFIMPACANAEEFQKQHLSTSPDSHLHWFPKTKQLLFTAHHTLFDATALWLFWGAYLDLVISPKIVTFGDEWKNLPLARDDLLGLPKYPSLAGNVKGLSMITNALKPDAIELPTLNTTTNSDGQVVPNGRSRNEFLRLALSAEQSTAIIQACKRRGTSITAAFFTAISLTCQKIQREYGSAGRYAIGFHNFDSRPWFPRELASTVNAGNDPHAMIPFTVDLDGKSFEDIAKITDENFKSIRADFGNDPAGLDAVSHMLKGLLNLDGPIATFPGFTSFGVADRVIKTAYHDEVGGWIKIEDSYHWIQNMVKGMNAVCVYNWKGRMYLGGCFNEAYHTKEMFHRLFRDSFDLILHTFNLGPMGPSSVL
ncbi:hypothetical protein PISL3812_09787 [Talaromyces islandicus]|uniref:Condensation domain-containing protein n=1 Tax=Talaromyces islandicus TaxID=28573 RepID=A0A0U1MC92_TALIS|nr:hypothetical protein PISL3812_09787 [Talaromyces islandicus]